MAKFDINGWIKTHLNEEEMKDKSNPGLELFNRMEAVNRFKTLDSFKNKLNELVEVWKDEGFEKDDILKYIDFLIEGGW